jgi:hypothetical protein
MPFFFVSERASERRELLYLAEARPHYSMNYSIGIRRISHAQRGMSKQKVLNVTSFDNVTSDNTMQLQRLAGAE